MLLGLSVVLDLVSGLGEVDDSDELSELEEELFGAALVEVAEGVVVGISCSNRFAVGLGRAVFAVEPARGGAVKDQAVALGTCPRAGAIFS